jgi:hypothetical protein
LSNADVSPRLPMPRGIADRVSRGAEWVSILKKLRKNKLELGSFGKK